MRSEKTKSYHSVISRIILFEHLLLSIIHTYTSRYSGMSGQGGTHDPQKRKRKPPEPDWNPTTHATAISKLTSYGQCCAPKRYVRYTPTQAHPVSGITFRSSNVPHGQGRIAFPLKSSLNPSASSASLRLSFATHWWGDEPLAHPSVSRFSSLFHTLSYWFVWNGLSPQ